MAYFNCPRCGKGRLYANFYTIGVVDACSACGLPLKQHEQGDGPAFFAIVIVGALVAIAASIVEIKIAPPYWVHGALWIPAIIIGSIACLRWLKALLIATQYKLKQGDFSDTPN